MRDLKTFHKDASTRVEAVDGTGATLVASTTYYTELTEEEGVDAGLSSIEWKWDASIIATITVEGSNFADLNVYDAASAGWVALSPAPIPTVTIAGGSASTSSGSWADQGFGRLRAKIVVGGTGGVLRGAIHHKR